MKYSWNNPDIFQGIFMGYNQILLGYMKNRLYMKVMKTCIYMQWKSYENHINEFNLRK